MKITTRKNKLRTRKPPELPGRENQSRRAVKYDYYRSQARPVSVEGRKNDDRDSVRSSQRFNKKTIIIVVVVIMIAVLELPLTMPPKIVISGSGGSTVPNSTNLAYRNKVEHIFDTGGMLSHTKLTLNRSELVDQLKNQYPMIQQASISYSLLSWHPIVTLGLEPARLVLESSAGSYLIGASGIVIGKANQTEEARLPALEDQSGLKPKFGGSVLPASYMDFIDGLLAQLGSNDVKPSKLVLPAASTELDLYPSGKGYFVKFNLRGQAREEAGTYLAAASYLAKQKITPTNYIDARLPGRVYYK